MSPEVQRVRELFVAAVKLPPAQWEDFLKEACDDDELRRQAIDLLREHEQAGSFLDRPAAHVLDNGDLDLSAKRGAAATQEGPGTTIGPYKLLELIGEGGMGEVWMAEQREPIQRKVALKIIKAGMDTRQVVARFEAERQALALMDHPNIASVFDGGSTAGGRPYFVMELVKGIPITRYCDEHRLTPQQRLELFLPVCQAIQHAHTKGLIHRDIKPANILVAPYDGAPVPKVIDFGVAKATGQRLTERTLFTGFGTVVGTLEYMSPEQAELNNHDIDTRSDVYSLGVVLYELLTGTTPLHHEGLKEAAFTEMLRIIREEDPPQPSTRLTESKETLASIAAQRHMEPAKLTRLVRGELDWIVMKALEKDRGRRYETANGLATDVQHYLADEPVLACPPTFGYRLRKLLRRNKGPVIAVSLLLLALVAGIIGTSWGLFRAERARKDAVAAKIAEAARAAGERRARQAETAERLRAEKNARLAVSAVDEIMATARQRLALYAPDQPMTVPKKPEGQELERELLEKGLKLYEQLAETNATDWTSRRRRAKAYASAAYTQLRLGNLAESEKDYGQAVRLMEEMAQERPNDFENRYDLADAYHWVSGPYLATGQPQPAEEAIRRALALFESLAADSPEQRLNAQHSIAHSQGFLAALLRDTGRPREAEQNDRGAIAWWENQAVEHPTAHDPWSHLSYRYFGLAEDLFQQGRVSDAVQVAERMAESADSIPDVPEVRDAAAQSHLHLAQVLKKAGQADKAVNAYVRAEAIYGKLAADHPADASYPLRQADTFWELGVLLESAGRVPEAEKAYRDALAAREQLATEWPESPQYRAALASTLQGVGEFLSRAGRPSEAEEFQRRALGIFAQLASQNPTERAYRDGQANSHLRLGWVLQSEGRLAEAEFTYREAVPLYEKLVIDYPGEPWLCHELGYAYWRLGALLGSSGRPQEAETPCRQAVASEEKVPAEFHNQAAYRERMRTFLSELAENLLRQGKHAEAAKVAEKMAETAHDEANARQTAAAVLDRCVPLAEKDARLSEADRKAAAKKYAERSQELTREAAKQSATTDEKPQQ